jgi:hypothetical protein
LELPEAGGKSRMINSSVDGTQLPLVLRPVGGEIYAHVFENPLTGVSRNLFWNMLVKFEPVAIDGDEWNCSFLVDWLTWPIPTWRGLEGMDLSKIVLPSMVEPSLYLMGEHNDAALHDLRLDDRQGTVFQITAAASTQVTTETERLSIPIAFTCPLQFMGIIVVNDNIAPRPTTPACAAEAVAQFVRIDGLRQPRSEGWRYVLDPEG